MRPIIEKKYDLVWISHLLEHQVNIHFFLQKVFSMVEESGYLAIAVPPRKPFIVSGHVNLFNPGLLVYRLVLAGFDCSSAKVFQYDGNICVLVKKKEADIPRLNYDIGDLEKLSSFYPILIDEGFNGDFFFCDLTDKEINLVYGGNAYLFSTRS